MANHGADEPYSAHDNRLLSESPLVAPGSFKQSIAAQQAYQLNLSRGRRNETIAEVSYEGGDSETSTSQILQTHS